MKITKKCVACTGWFMDEEPGVQIIIKGRRIIGGVCSACRHKYVYGKRGDNVTAFIRNRETVVVNREEVLPT